MYKEIIENTLAEYNKWINILEERFNIEAFLWVENWCEYDCHSVKLKKGNEALIIESYHVEHGSEFDIEILYKKVLATLMLKGLSKLKDQQYRYQGSTYPIKKQIT